MSLNQFIDTGADNATVNDMKKSIAREEDLQKAMNRAGLVQKEVQVKGKNGQMFTRKQWVKASDAQDAGNAGNISSSSIKDVKVGDTLTINGQSVKVLKVNDSNYLVKDKDGIVSHVNKKAVNDGIAKKTVNTSQNSATDSEKSSSFKEANKDPNMGKTLNVGTKKATVKTYDKLSTAEKREGADSIVSIDGKRYDYYANIMANGIGSLVPHQDDPNIDMSAAQFKPGDKGYITVRSETIPVKILDMATLNHKLMYLVQEDRPLAGGASMRKYWTADYNVKPLTNSSKKDKQTTSTDNVSKKVDDLVKQYSKADYDIQAAKFNHDANAETRARSRRTEAQKKLKELGYKPQKSKDVKGLFTAQKIEDSTLKDKSSGEQSNRFKREDFKLPKSGNRGNADELLSMVNKLDESCSVVGIRPEVVTGHGTFTVKTYKITGKPGSELEVRYGSDAQGVYFKVDGKEYRDVNSLVEYIKSSSSASNKSSSGKFKPSDFQFRSGGQNVADFVNSIDKELGVKKHTNGNVGFGTLSLENGASVNFGYDDTGAYATWNGSNFRDVKSLKSAMSGQKSDQGKMNHQTGVRDKKAPTMIEDYFAGNHSHDDGKKALAGLLGKGYSREDIMEQAEKSGVTWKKNDHAGINWMRASMAIQKHLNNSSK